LRIDAVGEDSNATGISNISAINQAAELTLIEIARCSRNQASGPLEGFGSAIFVVNLQMLPFKRERP
jgi:hypothetical protein